MRVVGLITEYNPFHNGHLFHFQQAKEITGADYTIAVMSGNFLQRGEPALFNKWARAAMAVAAGIDLVLELPFVYATRSAQYFARGAVEILNGTGVVTDLCFGSEAGEINPLITIAEILTKEPAELKKYIKAEMSRGVTLPVAQTSAMERYWANNPILKEKQLMAQMSSPNNILGIEYIRSLINIKSSIIPITVQRLSAQYHDQSFQDTVASATSIREFMYKRGFVPDELRKVIPGTSLDLIKDEINQGRGPVYSENLAWPLITRLRTIPKDDLAQIFDVNEGLENRIIAAAKDSTDFYKLVSNIKTKRYTWTRIQRILVHTLINFTKEAATAIDQKGPQYLRVLAFSEKGRAIIHQIKKSGTLPLITKVTKAENLNPTAKKIVNFDIMATDFYTALYPKPGSRKGRTDYLTGPVLIK